MNRSKLMRRLTVVAALLGVLVIAAGAPVLQAQPEAGTISTGAGVQVWNGHNCPANVPVGIAGLSAGLGGYETKIAWPAGRFDNTAANVGVTPSAYLTVKFGDYSWGAGNPPGNMANGDLATVALKPTATCGAAALTMSETQLVDINGTVIALTGQNGSSVSVFSRFDTSGSGALISSADVTAVVARLNQATGGTCGANYRYDTSLGGPLISSADVTAVVSKLNQSTGVVCTN